MHRSSPLLVALWFLLSACGGGPPDASARMAAVPAAEGWDTVRVAPDPPPRADALIYNVAFEMDDRDDPVGITGWWTLPGQS
jgi:hypothetical protein